MDALANMSTNSTGKKVSSLRSHSFKRFSVNELQEQLPPHSFVARCGWIARNMHTMFEYFFNSRTQDLQSALVLGGWVNRIGNDIQGGVPHTREHLSTAQEKLTPFIMALFRM